jgi:NADH:ubiquinone reductase (H+-translocating)
MDHDSITVEGPDGRETIRARTRIWAAGVQASPLARLLAERTGAGVDRAGRLAVRADCSLPDHPEVFAIGDMVAFEGVPAVAQPALQEGRYVGRLIAARLRGEPLPGPFRYRDKGSMATIGHRTAVADVRGLTVTGFPAYVLWAFVHVLYLVGWGNRVATVFSWMRSLWFTENRGHRVITFDSAARLTEGRTRSGRPAHILPRRRGASA